MAFASKNRASGPEPSALATLSNGPQLKRVETVVRKILHVGF